MTEQESPKDISISMDDVAQLANVRERIETQLRRRIVGMDAVIEHLLVSLFSKGHCLFIGVPGLAKTLLISTLSEAMGLAFSRIQFTPDLMPSDITGTDVLEEDVTTGKRTFEFVKGPVFCNLLLADEVNRTPPKTQAALLQAMQEGVVTASGNDYPLPPPFHVFATQNPIEQEGTYPLPEAQLDRFMLSINVEYPTVDQEVQIVSQTTGQESAVVESVVSVPELLKCQEVVRAIVAAPDIVRYAVNLATNSRPQSETASEFVRQYVAWGAGPRASQYLILGAKARAAMHGRPHASFEDVQAMAQPVLSHRLALNFQAEAERISATQVVDTLLAETSTQP
jgi:MoxR-like ATPase